MVSSARLWSSELATSSYFAIGFSLAAFEVGETKYLVQRHASCSKLQPFEASRSGHLWQVALDCPKGASTNDDDKSVAKDIYDLIT